MPLGLAVAAAVVIGVAAGVVTPVQSADAIVAALAAGAVAIAVDDRRARQSLLLASLAAGAAADGAIARDRVLQSPLVAWFDRAAPDVRAAGAALVEGTLVDDAAEGEDTVRLVIDTHHGDGGPLAGRIPAHGGGATGAGHGWQRR